MDARDQQVADLEAALRRALGLCDQVLRKSQSRIYALEKEAQHLRDQYRLLEGRYNALLEKAAAPPRPSCN